MSNVFLHLPNSLPSTSTKPDSPRSLTVLFFIPGNPGLIEYYFPFLKLLVRDSKNWVENSQGEREDRHIVIAGASLGGFESSVSESTAPASPTSTSVTDDFTETTPDGGKIEDLLSLYPLSFPRKHTGTNTLRDQIDVTYARITTLIERLLQKNQNTRSTPFETVQVILAGHSVGAYIALEVVRRHHEVVHSENSPSRSSSAAWSVPATLLLTPTIMNIAHSPSGRIATPLLSYVPFLPGLLQLGSSSLTRYLPTSWVQGLVRRVTGMKRQDMIDVTVNFLQRPGCVRQSLHLAGWEMKEIGEENWSDAIWGACEPEPEEQTMGAIAPGREADTVKVGVGVEWKAPTHYFLFAKEDHWVANETRETMIRTMGGRARVVVDEGEMGLVHAWCLEQGELVAEVVGGWMREILRMQ